MRREKLCLLFFVDLFATVVLVFRRFNGRLIGRERFVYRRRLRRRRYGRLRLGRVQKLSPLPRPGLRLNPSKVEPSPRGDVGGVLFWRVPDTST